MGCDFMILKDFRIEYQENPVGIDVCKPRFSWKLISQEENVLQTAYQIIVTEEGKIVWETGKRESSDSVLISYEGLHLEASTLYEVTVEVWDNKGNQALVHGSFETGLLNGTNFSAEFITHEFPSE